MNTINLLRCSKLELIKKINTLTNEKQTLEECIKDELYKIFMEKLNEPLEVERLKKENKRLRLKVKSLKEIIKEDK